MDTHDNFIEDLNAVITFWRDFGVSDDEVVSALLDWVEQLEPADVDD
jgi:hypothetical protein